MSKEYIESESLKDAMWKNFYKEEDKWEGIPEAEFLDVHGGCPRHWFQLGFGVALDAVVKADPVPHEMSAREYSQQRIRMCNAYGYCSVTCPLHNVEAGCREFEPITKEAEDIVEKWAKEHPETNMMTAKYALPRIDFKEGSDK